MKNWFWCSVSVWQNNPFILIEIYLGKFWEYRCICLRCTNILVVWSFHFLDFLSFWRLNRNKKCKLEKLTIFDREPIYPWKLCLFVPFALWVVFFCYLWVWLVYATTLMMSCLTYMALLLPVLIDKQRIINPLKDLGNKNWFLSDDTKTCKKS